MQETFRILIADRDHETRQSVERALRLKWAHCEVIDTGDGTEALELCSREDLDLVVLAIDLAGLCGLEVLRQIRQHSRVPVLMLTAMGREVDVVRALEFGADDCAPKDRYFELIARARSVLRRTSSLPSRLGLACLTTGS